MFFSCAFPGICYGCWAGKTWHQKSSRLRALRSSRFSASADFLPRIHAYQNSCAHPRKACEFHNINCTYFLLCAINQQVEYEIKLTGSQVVTSPQIFPGSHARFSSLRYVIELQQHLPGMDGSVGKANTRQRLKLGNSASTIFSSIKRLAATPTVHCELGIQKKTLRIIQKRVQCFWLSTCNLNFMAVWKQHPRASPTLCKAASDPQLAKPELLSVKSGWSAPPGTLWVPGTVLCRLINSHRGSTLPFNLLQNLNGFNGSDSQLPHGYFQKLGVFPPNHPFL